MPGYIQAAGCTTLSEYKMKRLGKALGMVITSICCVPPPPPFTPRVRGGRALELPCFDKVSKASVTLRCLQIWRILDINAAMLTFLSMCMQQKTVWARASSPSKATYQTTF